ncbi:MAG: cold shock domain protein CspD [Legionellales bacterium RIFCSPHIGHO2_12_FULL_35_11]|nr:MAG: cold shock domain protein CspD [Legionellales bacterium RIFCSPHIGHO2_12_FULL_35_11]
MATGEVKWFNNTKGWGFITADGGSEDIFVHFSAVNGTGYKTLIAGQHVSFDLQRGDRGLHAINVVVLNNVTESAET